MDSEPRTGLGEGSSKLHRGPRIEGLCAREARACPERAECLQDSVCGALQQGCKGQSELACSLLTLHVGSDASANKCAILQLRRWLIAKGGTPAKAAPLQGQPQQELHVWLLETVDWLWPQKIVRWLFNDAPTEALADRSVMPSYPGASGQLGPP